jgi:hypothetical protein
MLPVLQELMGKTQTEATENRFPWSWLTDVALLNLKMTEFLNSIVLDAKNAPGLAVLRDTAELVPWWPVPVRRKDPQLVEGILSKLELGKSSGIKAAKVSSLRLSTPVNRFCWHLIQEINFLRSLNPMCLSVAITNAELAKNLAAANSREETIDRLVKLFSQTSKIPPVG